MCRFIVLCHYVFFGLWLMTAGLAYFSEYISDVYHLRKIIFGLIGIILSVSLGFVIGFDKNPEEIGYIETRIKKFWASVIFNSFTLPLKFPIILYLQNAFSALITNITVMLWNVEYHVGILNSIFTGFYFFITSIVIHYLYTPVNMLFSKGIFLC